MASDSRRNYYVWRVMSPHGSRRLGVDTRGLGAYPAGMSSFLEAQKILRAHEGGYANDPRDLGGPTMRGWSALTLRRLGLTPEKCGIDPARVVAIPPGGKPPRGGDGREVHPQVLAWLAADGRPSPWGDWTCVRWMPSTTADQLYCAHFWIPGRYAEIADQTSATKIYDFAVNAGQANAWRVAQRAAGLALAACDGVPGAISLAAVNALGPAFVPAMASAMRDYYERAIQARPDNEAFRHTWMTRAQWGVR